MVPGPGSDAEVPVYWRALGLPGIIDCHVHFMPESVTRKVWAYFEAAGPLIGREWPIRYAWPESERLAHLRSMGVRAFPSLAYPHKPGMAAWLNEWTREFAAAQPDVLSSATMFPEAGVAAYLDEALRSGVQVVKVHVQVGGFDPRDPLLDEAWGLLADAAVPVIVHAGSGPSAGEFTGPGPIGEVLERHRGLRMVMAHMGMPEYEEFVGFAERYDEVLLDTTMCFTDFMGGRDLGRLLAPRLDALRDKVLLGTDFPTIPYAYAHQIDVLADLGLGDDWMRGVCWDNAARLFGISAPAS
jgi:predicted TIM-barrel fold metal-dependent hydrolase